MYLAVKDVKPLADYKLLLTFSNDEVRILDMSPYLNKGIYAQLKNIDVFNAVRISFDTIEWPNVADIDPEFVYDESVPYTVKNTG